jgi:DNA-binding NtrC family response regulator
MSKGYVLVVDDEPDIRSTVKDILDDEGYQVDTAENAEETRRRLRDRRPEAVLLDIWMPDLDGLSLLQEWAAEGELPCPVIMMSGHGNVETAVEATRLGAYGLLEKPLSIAKVLLTLERAIEAEKLQRENIDLRQSGPVVEPTGHGANIQRLREQVKRIAQHDTWVLITGEPGSGRETFARYLHAQSARHDRPFVEVPVSSIAAGNAARELFGIEEGDKIHYGRLEQAAGGILFLDEVADMDLDVQGRLVGALDTGSFLRVGGVEPVSVDVRIVAATHRNLEPMVQEGKFREDLFYHLNVVPLQVPALREHAEDVPDLLNYFVDFFSRQERLPYRAFGFAAQNFLRNYRWPGNIRELKNLVQRVLILGGSGEVTLEEVQGVMGAASSVGGSEGVAISFDQPLREAREEFERAYLQYQFEKHDGNVTKMAQEVGMERTHLYRKLRAVGVEIKDRR